MNKQISLSMLSDELARVWTRKRAFLSQIERIIQRGEWLTLIRPCYYKEKLFAQVVSLLSEKGLMLKKGTIVDLTLRVAPSSTKNREKRRDPDAHSVREGNQWHFGYKAHIGVDKDTGLVHTVAATGANVRDVTMMPELLIREEETVYGDSSYLGAERREEAVIRNKSGKRICYKINRRPSQSEHRSPRAQEQIKRREHEKSSVRAKVEHFFAVVKRNFVSERRDIEVRKNRLPDRISCLHWQI